MCAIIIGSTGGSKRNHTQFLQQNILTKAQLTEFAKWLHEEFFPYESILVEGEPLTDEDAESLVDRYAEHKPEAFTDGEHSGNPGEFISKDELRKFIDNNLIKNQTFDGDTMIMGSQLIKHFDL